MRTSWLILLCLALVAIAGPALADTNPYDVSWAALDPGDDWAARVIRSLFPIPGATPGISTGNEATAIQLLVGQFTGFVGAIAAAFVAYTVVMHIHRAAETSRVLGTNQSWMFVVRTGFAGVLMLPIAGGFSAGQSLVMQGALTGVGMAKALYANALQAIGPDGIVIAQPMIPGTQQIVAGLMNAEFCMDLINIKSNTAGSAHPLVPIPTAMTTGTLGGTGYLAYRYSFATGDETEGPVCGTVELSQAQNNPTTIGNVSIDMAAKQNDVLQNVLTNIIRPQVASVAAAYTANPTASQLVPLQATLTSAVTSYNQGLTTMAEGVSAALNAAIGNNTAALKNGSAGVLANEVTQSSLGWTGAGAYYLEIASMNAATISMLGATPIVTPPTYAGLSEALGYDVAPYVKAAKDYLDKMATTVATNDGTTVPTGVPYTSANARRDGGGPGILTALFGQLNLTDFTLNTITGYLTPNGTNYWSDPFGGLIALGQTLMNTSIAAMGAAAVLSSPTLSAGSAVLEFFSGNWGGAAATAGGSALMTFLSTPIFVGLLAILAPGIIIAYVLPLIPWVMWMAGVCGWIIMVCEAMIAVPLWALAHMTVGGDGLHGRATEGWALLFNVVFRPSLMVIGLFMSYFVFDAMSWLIRETFGVAAAFVLQHGWIVTNFVGLTVMLWVFVMTHVVAALMSFRMIALLPHHLPRLIGFASHNRIDMDAFQQIAGWGPGGSAASGTQRGMVQGMKAAQETRENLPAGAARRISGAKAGSEASDGMDSTTRAITGQNGEGEGGDV